MSVTLKDNSILEVSGALTLGEVAKVFEQAKKSLTPQVGTIDLSAVSAVDSSGLALLLEWQSLAKAGGRSLKFDNAPEDLLSLAALSEAVDLLGLSARQ